MVNRFSRQLWSFSPEQIQCWLSLAYWYRSLSIWTVFLSSEDVLRGHWKSEIQEWLLAVSQRTSVLAHFCDCTSRSTLRTCRRPLTSVIDVSPDVLLVPWVLALSTAVVDVFVEFTFGCDASANFFWPLPGKIRSAPCCKMLWVLRQPSRVNLR